MQIPKRRGDFHGYAQDPRMTQQTYDDLKAKLERLKKTVRPRLMKEVATLAEHGDFSENAAYQIAKGKLRGVNDTIHYTEEHLKKAVIISAGSSDRVEIGSTVTVEVNGRSKQLTILGSAEADPLKNIISYSSPLGAALLNKRTGETAIVANKNGQTQYHITAIN